MLLKAESGFATLLRTSPGFAMFFLLLVVLAIYFGFKYAQSHQLKDLLRQRRLDLGLFRSKEQQEE